MSKQQAVQISNFGRKSILLLCSTEYEKTIWASHNTCCTTITAQNTFKWKSYFWTYTTKAYRLTSRSTLRAMKADALCSMRKYIYYLTNVSKFTRRCYSNVGESGKYCSVYKTHNRAEYRLTNASLISSVSYFNLVMEALFCGLDWIFGPCGSVVPPPGWYGGQLIVKKSGLNFLDALIWTKCASNVKKGRFPKFPGLDLSSIK